jgi:hypothetical protein
VNEDMATRTKTEAPNHKEFQVKNWSSRNGTKIHAIMAHTTESADIPDSQQDLDGIQSWFNNPVSEASSWIGVDGEAHSRLWVPGAKKAWTMGHFDVNSWTLNIEFVGRAAQPESAWETVQLKHGAKWAAYAILNYKICTIDPENVRRSQLVKGVSGPFFKVDGLGRHKDLTDIGIGTHTDPGNNFPMQDWIDMVQYYCKNGWTKETTH